MTPHSQSITHKSTNPTKAFNTQHTHQAPNPLKTNKKQHKSLSIIATTNAKSKHTTSIIAEAQNQSQKQPTPTSNNRNTKYKHPNQSASRKSNPPVSKSHRTPSKPSIHIQATKLKPKPKQIQTVKQI